MLPLASMDNRWHEINKERHVISRQLKATSVHSYHLDRLCTILTREMLLQLAFKTVQARYEHLSTMIDSASRDREMLREISVV